VCLFPHQRCADHAREIGAQAVILRQRIDAVHNLGRAPALHRVN
jgi:hypothetical protein